jgi:small membrane protein
VIIKYLLVPAIVAAVYLSLRARSSLRGQARRKIIAFLTVVAGAISVIFPATLQTLADWVGVVRGTDLLVYVLALVIIYLVGSTGVRFREQESRLVLLARQVALSEAEARLQGRRVEYLPPRLRPPLADERPEPGAASPVRS